MFGNTNTEIFPKWYELVLQRLLPATCYLSTMLSKIGYKKRVFRGDCGNIIKFPGMPA